ncbi:amino acid adenylation domain-containing protein [Thalassomonas sp. RHCl1]|uniref:non-ribosomal peptide synthetase n=1 Tax=Thalassomonas sp. RHCl1 TaxID=2995320 RepID=UPI00248C895C|nr:amino acid adenylation domain-containing protein [Thalassomonas sp. RHCl1]
MSLWQNPGTDLGEALSHQQQLINGKTAEVRYFWLSLPAALAPASTAGQQQQRLLQLMENHQALASYYGVPADLSVTRAQVQAPRLNFRICEQTLDKQAAEQEAKQLFAEQQPHLLAWFWYQGEELNILLAGSSLTLDEYSCARIRDLIADPYSPQEEAELQYQEYSQWINELLSDEEAETGISYWRNLNLSALPGARLIEQQGKDNSPAADQAGYASLSHNIPQPLQQALLLAAGEFDCAPQQIALVVWAALLSKLNGHDELQLNYFHDCRLDYQEFESSLGLFTRPLPLPFYQLNSCDLEGASRGLVPLFEEMLEYQEYVSVIDEQNPGATQAGFFWHQQELLDDITSAGLPTASELLLQYTQTNSGDGGLTLNYQTGLYNARAMQRLLEHYQLLLAAALAAPRTPLAQLKCLLPDEELAATPATAQPQGNLVSLFKTQTEQTPDAPALRDGDNCYTYGELDRLSDAYAAILQQSGAGSEKIVALCFPRSGEFLVAMLAALKSGAAYLPLDPEQPQARLQQIIDDADPVVVITELDNLTGKNIVSPQQLNEKAQDGTFELQIPAISQEQLAYVLYTSGSTGQPKGVLVEHRQLSHYSLAAVKQLALPKQGHYGLISSLIADLGNTMLFPAWLTGGCLHLLNGEQAHDGQALARYCEQHPLDALKIVPSHLEALLCGAQSHILPAKALVLGGEGISSSLLTQLQQLNLTCRVYNHYGPTETTVGVLMGEVDISNGYDLLTSPLGDNRIYLLDKNQQAAISGQLAELYIGGAGVTRGYLNDTELTGKVYLDDPFIPGQKMYRSGDLAIRHADGGIRIIGRADHQVKIRGFRLALEEVQLLLTRHPDISQASLQIRGQGETAKLLAFVIPEQDKQPAQDEIIGYLGQYLPAYMVPAFIYPVKQFPFTSNGKIDRKQLLAQAEQADKHEIVAPRTPLEQQLAGIWKNILKVSELGVTDDFFALGGHSLAAIKVIALIRQQLHYQLPSNLLFQYKTIEQIAAYLESNAEVKRLFAFSETGSNHALVFMHAPAGHFNHYNQLINGLKNETDVYGLFPDPQRILNTAPGQLDQLLDDYIQQLLPLKSRQLILAGWSLAGRHMVLLADKMKARGFTVSTVAIIDYDPTQTLNVSDDAEQLISDFGDYLAAESIDLPEQDVTEITSGLKGSYQEAMQQLLQHPLMAQLISTDVSTQELEQQFMMRWCLKQHFYQAEIPVISTPLWVWRGNSHKAQLNTWQAYSSSGMQGWEIDADHHSILAHQELLAQFRLNIQALDGQNTADKAKPEQITAQAETIS